MSISPAKVLSSLCIVLYVINDHENAQPNKLRVPTVVHGSGTLLITLITLKQLYMIHNYKEIDNIIEHTVEQILAMPDTSELMEDRGSIDPPYVCYDSINVFVELFKKNLKL